MKLKRLLTAALSAVMALSVCALPAMAADGATTPNPVWSQNYGSITIHKYELNNDAKKITGTGSANDTVDAEAKPLAGAEFTVYQIWNENTLKGYYDGVTATPTTGVFDISNYAKKNATTGAWELALKPGFSATPVNKVGLLNPQTTPDSGTVTFDKLDLGLYLVLETKLPDLVVEAAEPAIISVPMQKDSNNTVADANKQPVTEWLYDVHIFPKNATKYGSVNLIKKGYTGSTEDGNLPNVTYKLYKYTGSDATSVYTESATDWLEITRKTTTAGDNKGAALNLVTNGAGEISIDGLTKGKYCFVEQSAKVQQDGREYESAYIVDKEPIYFTVKADGSYDSTAKDETVGALEAKNYKPNIEKLVGMKSGATITYATKADYSVGDYVPYQVTITVPENIEKLDTFVVTDTPQHLEFVNDTQHPLVVKTASGTALTENVDYTVAKESTTNGFTLAFTNPGEKLKAYKGSKIIVTYYAKLLDSAVITTAGNPNTISLKYDHEIGVDGKPTRGKTTEIKNDAVVYSFGIHIKKVDGKNAPLKGVKFDLYKEDQNGTVLGNQIGLGDTTKLSKVASDLTTNDQGEINKDGLANGIYYLVETETLAGYNLLSGPVKVDLNITYTAKWTEKNTYDENGNLILHEKSSFSETFSGGEATATNAGYITKTIVNRKGFQLPVTGGFGTLLFSGIGVLLVLAGVSVLFSLKKKNNRA